MGEIHEFILARVQEESLVAFASLDQKAYELVEESRPSRQGSVWSPRRALTEGEIKSELVGVHDDGACPRCLANAENGCETLRLIAKAWSEHPDYRPDWSSFHDGDSQLSPSRATDLLSELSHPQRLTAAGLTDRETEVLLLVAKGVTYRDIGKHLFISRNTVANHARNIVERSPFHRQWGEGAGPAG